MGLSMSTLKRHVYGDCCRRCSPESLNGLPWLRQSVLYACDKAIERCDFSGIELESNRLCPNRFCFRDHGPSSL
jgi:hypothetical protein